jgi:hypothetical protein
MGKGQGGAPCCNIPRSRASKSVEIDQFSG